MDEIREQLDDHETRLKSLEDTRLATLKTLADMDTKHEQRLRDVRQDLSDRIKQLDESAKDRDNINSERLTRTEDTVHRIDDKLDGAIKSVREATPTWVGPVLGILIAGLGWLVEYLIFYK